MVLLSFDMRRLPPMQGAFQHSKESCPVEDTCFTSEGLLALGFGSLHWRKVSIVRSTEVVGPTPDIVAINLPIWNTSPPIPILTLRPVPLSQSHMTQTFWAISKSEADSRE